MARKITLKRIGLLIPTLCLIVLILLILVLAWLGLVGFPKPLLREIETIAAEEGIYLSVDKATLEFTRGFGLKLHQVKLYESDKKDTPPLISVPYADLGVEVRDLLVGEIQPHHLQLRDAELRIPILDTPTPAQTAQPAQYFSISGINLMADHSSEGSIRLTEGRLLFDQIPIRIEGSISDTYLQSLLTSSDTEEKPESTEKIDLASELAALGDIMRDIRSWVATQQWGSKDIPQLGINVRVAEEITCHLTAQLPALRHENFRLKNTLLDVSYAGDRVTINRLETHSVIPAGKLIVQGAYDLKEGAVSFDINSNLPLIYFVREVMNEEDVAVLANIPALMQREANTLQLQGSVKLDEDYAPSDLLLRGHIEQQDVQFRSMDIEQLKLAFYYESGSFSLNELQLTLPDGSIRAKGFLKDGKGQLSLDLHLLEKDICSIINSIVPDTLSAQFSEALDLKGHLDLKIKTDISTPSFRPGESPLTDFIPNLRQAELSVGLPQLSYTQDKLVIDAEQPSVSVKLEGLNGVDGARPDLVEHLKISLKAGKLTLKDGDAIYLADQFLTELHSKDIRWGKEQDIKELLIGSSSLFTYLGKVEVPGVQVENINLNLREINNIRPLSKPDELINSGIVELQTGAMDIFKRRAEGLAVSLQLRDQRDLTGDVTLTWDKKGGHLTSLHLDWEDWESLTISEINSRLSSKQLMQELPEKFYDQYGIALSKDLILSDGRVHLTTKDWNFAPQSASLSIRADGIQRKAVDIPSMKGNAALDLSLAASLNAEVNAAGDFLYTVSPLVLKHQSGSLEVTVQGNTASHVQIKGSNTIGLQYLDAIINLAEAHAVMRDFKLNANSRLNLSNIDAMVNYANGVSVYATTDLSVADTGYALGGIIEENGRERVDTSLQTDPFGYFSRLSAHTVVDIRYGAKDANGKALSDKLLILIEDAVIDKDNRPWFARMKQKPGVAQSRIEVGCVTLDLQEGYVRIQDLSGEIYPAYTLGMFYAPLYSILVDLQTTHPVKAKINDSLFPFYSDCKRSMYSTVEVSSPHLAKYNFAGIGIPLERLHGFVRISDDYVQLDRFRSYTWQGQLDLNLRIGISGKKTSLDGYVKAVNMNLKQIAGTFGAEISPALCYADFRFRSPSTEIKDIDGYGQLYLRQGQLMELGIFAPISELIYNLPSYIMFFKEEAEEAKRGAISKLSYAICDAIGNSLKKSGQIIGTTIDKVPGVNMLLNYGLSDAHADFRIKNGRFSTDNFVASGSNLRVPLTGYMDLETLDIKMKLWPDLGSILSLALSPITSISEHIISIELTGKIDKIGWRIGANSPMNIIKSAQEKLKLDKLSLKRGSAKKTPTSSR